MDRSSMSPCANPGLATRLRDFITRRPEIAAALRDVLREQDDLAFRVLCRRRTGDRMIG